MTCPKFDTCNAPICPLDPERAKRSYLKGEPICLFMLEHGKAHGAERIERTIGGSALFAVGRACQEAEKHWRSLYRRLQAASDTPTRLGGAP